MIEIILTIQNALPSELPDFKIQQLQSFDQVSEFWLRSELDPNLPTVGEIRGSTLLETAYALGLLTCCALFQVDFCKFGSQRSL
jgi:hypothetical protein